MAGSDKPNEPRNNDENAEEVSDGNEENIHEEYHQLDSKLDELNEALDVIEQKNDDIKQRLHDLLQANRDIREELKNKSCDD